MGYHYPGGREEHYISHLRVIGSKIGAWRWRGAPGPAFKRTSIWENSIWLLAQISSDTQWKPRRRKIRFGRFKTLAFYQLINYNLTVSKMVTLFIILYIANDSSWTTETQTSSAGNGARLTGRMAGGSLPMGKELEEMEHAAQNAVLFGQG